MIVLSLFDGMSCGRIALERAGIKFIGGEAMRITQKQFEKAKRNPHIKNILNILLCEENEIKEYSFNRGVVEVPVSSDGYFKRFEASEEITLSVIYKKKAGKK